MRLLELGRSRVSGVSGGLNFMSWKEVMSFPWLERKLSFLIVSFASSTVNIGAGGLIEQVYYKVFIFQIMLFGIQSKIFTKHIPIGKV